VDEYNLPQEPYPGLRSFYREETHIFFGREDATNDMVDRLSRYRFLAVTGTSGSGKSSLVRTGLLDGLDRGLLAEAGANWRIADFRPGQHPLAALADALIKAVGASDEHESLRLQALLGRGTQGLVEWLKDRGVPPETNILLLADQFEEIFRFRHGPTGDDVDSFVSLLLSSAKEIKAREKSRKQSANKETVKGEGAAKIQTGEFPDDWPIYVVITMRSDFLGECAQFNDLAEIVNDAQYLTPRLTREQCEKAITGPAAVFGGRVEKALVNRLLNDMGTNADQLPLVQHALMRLWQKAAQSQKASERLLTLDDYEKLGGIRPLPTTDIASASQQLTNALSAHADELLATLSKDQKNIAKSIFCGLVESQATGGRDVRRPTTLGELAKLADAPVSALIPVIEIFRAHSANLLAPPPSDPLDEATKIDIGHESLIRQWGTLRQWMAEEREAAETYQRLEQNAKEQHGTESLLKNPFLGRALEWRDEWHASPAWAARYARYGSTFHQTMDFLAKSEQAHKKSLDDAKAAARRAANRFRAIAAVLAMLLTCAGVLAVYIYDLKKSVESEANRIAAAQSLFLFEAKGTMRNLMAPKARDEMLKILIDNYNSVLDVYRTNSNAFLGRCIAFYILGTEEHYEDAVKDCSKAIELNPKNALAFYNRGIALRAAQRETDAQKDFSRTIDLAKPGDDDVTRSAVQDARRSRGVIFFLTGEFDKADSDFETGIGNGDPYSMIWDYILHRTTKTQPISELEQNAAKLENKNWPYPVIEFLLGKIGEERMRSQAKTSGGMCEAFFYSGEKLFLDGNVDAAKRLFTSTLDPANCPGTFLEVQAARDELKRLQSSTSEAKP
jgi:lipoprotein NlpI